VAVPVDFMSTINVVHGHAWTHSIIWRSSVAKASLQNFDHISVFLPASESARAPRVTPRVAIGLASREVQRSVADTQQVYGILLKMLDRWNAHDIEGYMEVYCKSPELLVVVDAEQFNGWQQLHDSYINGYLDRIAMGFIQPKRIQIKLLKPDLALALTWWSVTFPSSKQEMTGNSTMNLQKFDDGWKIVASHTSVAGM
jgi:ketosteroid isomerase-like protein